MKKLIFTILSLTMVFISIPSFAGDIDSPGSPSSGSGMYTLLQLYNYLNYGSVPTIVTSFQEPSDGPDGTMKSTKSIYDDIKSKFDQCNSEASDVAAGKKFFSTQGTWGVQTGTGITSTGDAVAADVLSGKTFSNSSSTGLSGAMPSITPQPITPTTTSQTISQGYHTGSGYVEGDTDLIPANIKSEASIFGVNGDTNVVNTSSGDATATDIRTGDKAWVDGSEVTGVGCAEVAKTGQTMSYVNYDDGYYKKGVAWPSPRFSDNDDGTVTDNLTGLIWLKDVGCMGVALWGNSTGETFTKIAELNSGTDFSCSNYSAGEFNNWRLPNIKELLSLIDWGRFSPALPSNPFTNIPSNGSDYWSSTTYETNTANALIVSLADGTVNYGDKNGSSTYYVWPVRGGQ